MNIQTTQNLRRKLERRIERIRSAKFGVFQQALKEFFIFFDNDLFFCELKDQLIIEFPGISSNITQLLNNSQNYSSPTSEKEMVAFAYEILRQVSLKTDGVRGVLNPIYFYYSKEFSKSMHEPQHLRDERMLEVFKGLFLEPFYLYIDEQLDYQKAILSFIIRYKHRSEWFNQDRLLKIADDEKARKETEKKGRAEIEDCLALDLYAYLYDEGIDFHIAPSSIRGKIDLIEEGKRPLLEGQENSSHRLLADAKVFDGKNRDCAYLGKGFGQIISYCKKYNESYGYLIIYNISDGELEFELEKTLNEIPIYEYFGKTIFFVVIDINKTRAASKTGKPKVYSLKENHLIKDSVDQI